MEKKEKAKLLIRKELLRELKPSDLVPVAGGGTRRTDVSNCCCDPCMMTGSCTTVP